MSDETSNTQPPEPDAPPMRRISLMVGGLLLAGLLVGLGLWQLFRLTVRGEVYRKELAITSKELAEQQALDRSRLTQYALIDEKTGRYQIPVHRAMERLLAHPQLLQAMAITGPTSLPASRPASAPAQPTRDKPAPMNQKP